MTKIEQKIPEGWSVKKVNDIGRVITGSTPPMSCSENYGGTFCWATAQDFKGKYITDTVVKLSSKGKELSRILPVGSVLVICIASIGLNAIAKIEMATNQQINAIIVNKNNNNEFVYYQICQNVNVLRKYAGAGGMLILPKGEFEKISFIFPPLPEQEKIAGILSCWDDGIEKLSALIEKKKIQKKALMQQLLTGKHRLKGFSTPWHEVKLGDIADLYQPQTISQSDLELDGYPVYGANGLIGYYHKFNHETWQIMITCRGSTCGTVNRTSGKSWITGNAMVVNVDNYKNNKLFLFFKLLNENFLSIVSGSGQPQIVRTPLAKWKLYIPSDLAEQKAIAEILSKADEEIELLNKKLEAFKQEKKALMQQLLTGKIRVKVN